MRTLTTIKVPQNKIRLSYLFLAGLVLITTLLNLSSALIPKAHAQDTALELKKYVLYQAVTSCYTKKASTVYSLKRIYNDGQLLSIANAFTMSDPPNSPPFNSTTLLDRQGSIDGYSDCIETVRSALDTDIIAPGGTASYKELLTALGYKPGIASNLIGLCFEGKCTNTSTTTIIDYLSENEISKALDNFRTYWSIKGYPTQMTDAMRVISASRAMEDPGACAANPQNRIQAASIWDDGSVAPFTTIPDHNAHYQKVHYIDTSGVAYDALVHFNDPNKKVGVYPDQPFKQWSCADLAADFNKNSKNWTSGAGVEASNTAGNVYSDALTKKYCDDPGNSPALVEKYDTCSKNMKQAVTSCMAQILGGATSTNAVNTIDANRLGECVASKIAKDATEVKQILSNAKDAAQVSQSSNGNSTTDPCAFIPANTPMSWLACGIFTAVKSITEGLKNTYADILYTNVDATFTNPGFKNAAAAFRNLGMVMVVISGLIMVVSQAAGLEIFDAYTIKKILPKLGVALVGMAISWPLMRLGANLSNDLGFAIADLFNKLSATTTGVGTSANIGTDILGLFVTGGALVGAGALLGVWGGILLLISIIISFLAGLVVLVIQKLLLFTLILVAPLAFAASILPGTEKLWKLWKSNIIKLLAMFLVIMGIIKIGDFLAAVAFAADKGGLLAIAAKIGTVTATVKAPQITSQILGGVTSLVAGATYKMAGGLKAPVDKMRQQNTAKRMQYFGNKANRWGAEKAVEVQRRLTKYGSREDTGAIGRFMARRGSKFLDNTFGGYGHDRSLEAKMSALQAQESKKVEDQIATGDDRGLRGLSVNKEAALEGQGDSKSWAADVNGHRVSANGEARVHKDGRRQFKSAGGAWIDETDVDEAYRKYGRNRQAQQAVLSYEMRKASSDEDVARFNDGHTIKDLMRDAWGVDPEAETGMWKGATFQNQGQHLHLKYTDLDGKLDYKGYANELHQRKSVGQISQFSGESIDQMVFGYNAAQAAGDQEAMNQYKGTLEAFMQRGFGGSTMVPDPNNSGQMMPNPAATPSQPMAAAQQEMFRTATYGAADVSEKVRKAAVAMGVYAPLDPTTNTLPPPGTTYSGLRLG